ncbi:MAG: phosphoglucosamine mutase [Thermoplasmata archaeon]
MGALFRTNGIREVVGDRLTAPFATTIAQAIASAIDPTATVAIGRDGRTSSSAFSDLIAASLLLAGRDVVDLGLLPTPAVQYNVPRVGAGFGVVVTASHNPPEYNGIKCLDERGHSVSTGTERKIEQAIDAGVEVSVPFDRVGERRPDPHGAERYLTGVLGEVDAGVVARQHFTIVLDCANGATAVTSPTLLRRLGCRVITLNGHVDGCFPGRPSEPNERTLSALARAVPEFGADLGIAHDGDGDRTLFVDGRGRFVPGDRSFALLARAAARASPSGVVVTPLSTSQVVEDVVTPLGTRVRYTAIGSPKLTGEIEKSHAVIGGEENGGVVFPHFQLARDGGLTAAALLELLAKADQPLDALLDDLPRYGLVKERVPCPPDRAAPLLATVAQAMSDGARRVLTLDGFKIYTDGGWLLLRPSGTEPVIRIFAENRDPSSARRLADEAVSRVRELLELEGPLAP